MLRWASLFGSIVVSLVLAELAASAVAGGAYPYLNLFVPDARLGVVLEATASTRVRSRRGHITAIDTDEHGRRRHPSGAGPKRILLLGDSQAFGYLVEAEDAVAAQLGRITGAEVIDAAVPSYGPHEYVAIAERLIPELRPEQVVFVANVANDWWEANADNTRRSTARDGWLVTKADRSEPLDFPFRRFFFGRSHLVLAMRRVAAARSFDVATPQRLMRDLDRLRQPSGGHRSRLTPFLLAVDAAARANGASTIAVALPLDVMVSPAEWAKYSFGKQGAQRGERAETGARALPERAPLIPPRDVSAAGVLLEALVADAREHDIRAIDLRAALAEAEPGAFLADDPHLSPKGHGVFAREVAR